MFIRRNLVAAAIMLAIGVLTVATSPSFAAASRANDVGESAASTNPGAALEAMAQQKFGASISAAERKLLRAAPLRDVPWLGPSDDPDNVANDTAHAENWGGERTVRAELIVWLLADSNTSRFVHPSGLALAAGPHSGNLRLAHPTSSRT